MASKWMKNKEDLFNKFKEEKEQQKQSGGFINRSDIVWKTPAKGTVAKPKIYTGRFLMDQNDNFYKTYFYHMFKNAKDEWVYILCPTTFGKNCFCPVCAVNKKLYNGSKEDRKAGYKYKRNVRHCGNFYITNDPRDAETDNEDEINTKKVKIYEFPDKVESKIDTTLKDTVNGVGIAAFDPGEDGFDFVLSVGSTKPVQEEGPNKDKSFPDYSNSVFARNPYALGTDEEIEKIMESRHNLDEYLEKMKRSDEDLKEIIKAEMMFDLVEEFYDDEKQEAVDKIANLLNDKKPKVEDDIDDSKFNNPLAEKEVKPEPEKDKEPDFDDSTSDEDLLADIDNLLNDD